MKLWQKVTLGLILGIICGLTFGKKCEYVKPLGDIFINLIRMVVIPLVYLSLVAGITSMKDPTAIGRISVKCITAFLMTTAFAILIGITIGEIFRPGEGIVLSFEQGTNLNNDHKNFSLIKLITNIVPSNAFGAFANGEMLQVVFFALFTGIALNKMGEQGKRLASFFQLLANMSFKMISMVMNFSPYGAFALSAWLIGSQGIEVVYSLAKLIMAVLIAMLVQYLLFGVMIKIFARVSPMPFYRKSFEYQILAFSTSSSKATLPTTMEVCRNKLGISETSTSFILPLGASMNMDGMAIYLGMCAIFFAQALGVTLQPHDYMMIMITSTIGSIGAAGIPSGSLVMLPMVLASIHLPIEGVALIAGIDRILDMLRTTINITGDATVTLIVDKTEGTLDERMYHSS
jgi:Na+/H+-dicarboxylate symporter